jgi:hypothetical protein
MKAYSHLLPALTLLVAGSAFSQDHYRDDRGEDIQLVCYGGAEKPTAEVRSGFEWDAQQHKYVPKQSVESGKSDFQATINVSIHGDRAEIQLPKSLIPPLHGDSNNGWWTINDLIVGHDEIRGQFRLNGLNQPRLSINRRSGAITIDGMIKFSGRCDPDDGHRRF